MNTLSINGTDVTGSIAGIGLNDLEITVELNTDDKTVTKSVTENDILFIKDAFTFLKGEFFTGELPCTKELEGNLYIDCCKLNLDVKVLAAQTDYCPYECQIKTPLVSNNEDSVSYDCLSDAVDFLDDKYKIYGTYTTAIFGIVPGQLNYPAPTVYSFVRSRVEECGLTFQSSILSVAPWSEMQIWIPLGERDLSVIDLLKIISPVFAADYRIQNNTLIFEKETFFASAADSVINLDDANTDGCIDGEICLNYSEESGCRFQTFSYELDKNNFYIEGEFNGGETFDAEPYTTTVDYRETTGIGTLNGVCDDYLIETVSPTVIDSTGRILINPAGRLPSLWIKDVAGSPGISNVIYDATEGYNYPLHINPDSTLNNIYTDFLIDLAPTSNCKINLDDFTYVPPNFCDFVRDLLTGRGIQIGITTPLGKVVPNRAKIVFSNSTIEFSDLTNE